MLSGMETAVSHPSAYRITIPGLLRAKGRPRFGNGRTFTDAKTVQAEKHIQRHAMEQIGKSCLTGPLHLALTISIAPPPSWSRKKTADALAGRILPTSRPDIDNQMKTAADALNGIAWKDDAQIVDAILSRRYDDRNIADSNNQYDYLSKGADFRRWALGDLINKEIEARNISDVIIRLRFQEASQGTYNDHDAILRDLERLHASENSQRPDPASGDIPPDRGSPAASTESHSGPENRATPPSSLDTATKRRAEVERILRTPEGARMSLRQVAGMAGVSPSTVMKVRSCLQEEHCCTEP